MSTGESKPAAKALRPRDASTLIILDRTGPAMRVLMGKRRMEQAFMPGKFVFPGGRVDKTDRLIASADELSVADTAKLLLQMKGGATVSRTRAVALAAIRETFEEAGIIIGARPTGPAPKVAVSGWSAFFACGYIPTLSPLCYLARAITPPGRPRRYDTRFFCMDASAIAHRTDIVDGELSGLHWLTLEDAHDLDLPAITRVILEDLADRLRLDNLSTPNAAVPFYHHRNGSFRRELLLLDEAGPAEKDASNP
jgi:8-oxo-dGTP pyrophosphatase MutT (NUDIX family)